jgi:hypothetical protein
LGRVTGTKRNAKYDEPFTKKEMERAVADLPTYKADAADLKSELIKAGGSALVKLLLKLVNWVWELETLPTAWSQGVIVNLFKAGDTQLPGNYRGSPGINLPQDVYKHVAQAHEVPSAPARGSGGVQKQNPAQTTCSCSRILKRLARPTKLSMRSFWTCAKRMIRSGGGYP